MTLVTDLLRISCRSDYLKSLVDTSYWSLNHPILYSSSLTDLYSDQRRATWVTLMLLKDSNPHDVETVAYSQSQRWNSNTHNPWVPKTALHVKAQHDHKWLLIISALLEQNHYISFWFQWFMCLFVQLHSLTSWKRPSRCLITTVSLHNYLTQTQSWSLDQWEWVPSVIKTTHADRSASSQRWRRG